MSDLKPVPNTKCLACHSNKQLLTGRYCVEVIHGGDMQPRYYNENTHREAATKWRNENFRGARDWRIRVTDTLSKIRKAFECVSKSQAQALTQALDRSRFDCLKK